MAVKRKITKVPIEPFHLNQYSPGSLQLPNIENIWGTSGQESWKASYLIWKNHGYTNDGNLIVGYLDLEQKSLKNGKCEISFFEKRVHNGGKENIIEGNLITDASDFYKPLEWKLTSKFIGANGEVIPSLNFQQKTIVEDNQIIYLNNGKRVITDKKGELFHEFGLIRYLFDPGFATDKVDSFTFLENGLIIKPGHQISEASELNQTLGERNFKCFLQIGYGINPIEYYVDENNLLCAAISCFNAKIYNSNAAEYYNEFISKSFQN